MDHLIGLLKVRVLKGVNLAYRDATGSDPYVVLRLGDQKLKTSVINNNVNPVWDEDLTLTVSEPVQPLIIKVYDKDTFTPDDKMGDAEVDIQPILEAVKMKLSPDVPDETIITIVKPNRQNCLADESAVVWKDGQISQELILRLKNVESGELELQLLWVNVPGAQGV